MAKLTILAALLVALIAISEARTIITTTTVEDENPRGSSRCRQQFQRQRQLDHCQMHLEEQSQGPFGDEVILNPRQQQQHLQQCCQQLEKMDRQCRCEGLRQMMEQMRQEGQMQGEEMMQIAQTLPRECNMDPQRCQLRAVFF